MKRVILLIKTFGVIALIFSVSCKNKCETHDDVSQESKDYGYFQIGSYWVYQNDSTFQVDSFNTISATTGIETHTLMEEKCNPRYYYLGFANSIAASNISGDSIEYSCGSTGVDFYKNDQFLGVYFTTDAQGYSDDTLWTTIENLYLNGNNFSNVYMSKDHWGANIYFVKNIGAVKTEIKNDSTNYVESWSLLRYHVIQ